VWLREARRADPGSAGVIWALLLAASPLDAQEAFNDALEDRLDALCTAVKAGSRHEVFPKTSLAWVTSCSLRALKLEKDQAHLLYELEGRDGTGARVIERGEADATLRKLALEDVRITWSQTVHRQSPRFVDVAESAGLTLPARKAEPTETMAGGLTVRDFNHDGNLDIVVADGHSLYLFESTGKLKFERAEILTMDRQITGATAGDFDNDGVDELVVTSFPAAPPIIVSSHGQVAAKPFPRGSKVHSAVTADFDGDGNLDVVLLPYGLDRAIPDKLLEATNGEPLHFFRGDGALGFKPWPEADRVAPKRWSLAAVSADLLSLGRPQLYVANDFGSNDLYVFDADGGVRNVAKQVGLDDPGNGMSAEVGDFDGDGRLDLYVANMFSKAGTRVVSGANVSAATKARLEKFSGGNTLYLAQPDGGFVERAQALGVNRGFWAFGSILFDADNDGRLEVAVADGFFSHPKRKDL
jgi:hypothetical protein